MKLPTNSDVCELWRMMLLPWQQGLLRLLNGPCQPWMVLAFSWHHRVLHRRWRQICVCYLRYTV